MLGNIVAFTILLCFIKASVVVNIFDDDVETRHSLDFVQSCNLQWCEQQCHNMGFPGGVCVGDRCKCDIISDSTDLHTLQLFDVKSCNLRWCEQQCHRMGFPGGVCVGDRCKCNILKESSDITNNEIPTDESSEKENKIGEENDTDEKLPTANTIETASSNSHTLGKCSPIHCFHSCRRKGMHGGVCSPMLTCICY